jgi:actin-related protein
VPSFYVAIDGVLGIYSSGRTTGVVMSSGDCVTYSVPVFEGYSLNTTIEKINFAGRNLTNYFANLDYNYG